MYKNKIIAEDSGEINLNATFFNTVSKGSCVANTKKLVLLNPKMIDFS